MGVVAEWDEPPSKDQCQKVGIVDFANIAFRCAKNESKAFLQRVLGTIRSIAASPWIPRRWDTRYGWHQFS